MLLDAHKTILQDAKTHWQRNRIHNRKVVLLYALPALALPLIAMAINLFLDTQFSGAGAYPESVCEALWKLHKWF